MNGSLYSRIATLALLTTLTLPSLAGVYIVNKVSGESNGTNTIYLESDRMRMETTEGGEDIVVIFRGDTETMYVIEKDKNRYMSMTKEEMARMGQQAKAMMDQLGPQQKAMMEQMQEQMKNMTPEQRKMMEQMMPDMGKAMGMPEAAEPLRYESKGSGGTVNGWATTHYVGFRGDAKEQEVWAADLGTLGVSESDLAVFKKMQEFVETLTESIGMDLGGAMFAVGDEEPPFDGIPVKSVDYENGRIVQTEETVTVEKRGNPAALFELPSGLKKIDPMSGMGGQ